jgi:acyl carrier protein
MAMNDIQSTVIDIVAQAASVDPSAVPMTATLKDSGIASLDAIEILFQLEEKYDVQLGENDIDLGSATVPDLIAAVERAIARKQAVLPQVRMA